MRDQIIKDIFEATKKIKPFNFLESKQINLEKNILLENIIQFGINRLKFLHMIVVKKKIG